MLNISFNKSNYRVSLSCQMLTVAIDTMYVETIDIHNTNMISTTLSDLCAGVVEMEKNHVDDTRMRKSVLEGLRSEYKRMNKAEQPWTIMVQRLMVDIIIGTALSNQSRRDDITKRSYYMYNLLSSLYFSGAIKNRVSEIVDCINTYKTAVDSLKEAMVSKEMSPIDYMVDDQVALF